MLQYIFEALDEDVLTTLQGANIATDSPALCDSFLLNPSKIRLTIIDTDTGKVIYRSGTDLTQ